MASRGEWVLATTMPAFYQQRGIPWHGFQPVGDVPIAEGRRIGHTATLGTLNEIPGALYTGDGDLEHLFIPHALSGHYSLDVIGTGGDALYALSDANGNGFWHDGPLAAGTTISDSAALVPEPSAAGLLSVGCVAMGAKRRKIKGHD